MLVKQYREYGDGVCVRGRHPTPPLWKVPIKLSLSEAPPRCKCVSSVYSRSKPHALCATVSTSENTDKMMTEKACVALFGAALKLHPSVVHVRNLHLQQLQHWSWSWTNARPRCRPAGASLLDSMSLGARVCVCNLTVSARLYF